jgi:hypothetical protein
MAFSEEDTRNAFELIKETYEENNFNPLTEEGLNARLAIESFSSTDKFATYFIDFLKKHHILRNKNGKLMLNQQWRRPTE